jgi:tRNA (guanine10-N2)-methyltransferase
LVDLISFSKKSLKIGGRLIYWFPTNDDFEDSHLPVDENFILLSNIPERLSRVLTRRLITMERVK